MNGIPTDYVASLYASEPELLARLVIAGRSRDDATITRITDELANLGLVRHRDDTSRFGGDHAK